MLFTGAYEHSIDAKNRLAIPAPIRHQLSSGDTSPAFYMHIGQNGSMWLWPERTFEKLAGDVEPTLTPSRHVEDFDEVTFPLTHRAELDSAGRVTIPEFMLAEAGLTTKVVILGMRHHLEIRDPEQWQQRVRQQGPRRSEIASQAEPEINKHRSRRSGDS